MTLAAPVLDDWNALGKQVITFLLSIPLIIMYLTSVIATWVRSNGRILPTLSAAIGGIVVLGLVLSQTVLSKKFQDEFERDHTSQSAVVTAVVDAAGSDGASW